VLGEESHQLLQFRRPGAENPESDVTTGCDRTYSIGDDKVLVLGQLDCVLELLVELGDGFVANELRQFAERLIKVARGRHVAIAIILIFA